MPLHQENEFKSSVSPICLPWNINLDYETQDDQIATGAGWGRTVGQATKNSERYVYRNNININVLQVLGLPIANAKCKNDPNVKEYIKVFDAQTQICAGGEIGKQRYFLFTESKSRKWTFCQIWNDTVKNEVQISKNDKMIVCKSGLISVIRRYFHFGSDLQANV